MNKQAVFVIAVDIIGWVLSIVSLFLDDRSKGYVLFGMLCMTFIAYHVVSIWLINRIKDEEDYNEPTD